MDRTEKKISLPRQRKGKTVRMVRGTRVGAPGRAGFIFALGAWLCLSSFGIANAVPAPRLAPARTAVVCLESRTVPAGTIRQSLAILSSGIRPLVYQGDPGVTVYVRDATYGPRGALQTVAVDRVPIPPPPCPNPFDQQCKRQLATATQRAVNALNSVRSTTERQLSRLASLRVPSGHRAPDDLGGCIYKAQELLGKRTTRYLIIVGSFGAAPPQRGAINLPNVDLDIVYWCTRGAIVCRHQRAVWGKFFHSTHVIDQAWWDPSSRFSLLGKS